MFTLLSAGKQKTAAYWEGWQAVELHRQCSYTTEVDRKEWAKGFADGVDEERGSKVWYKSRTLIVGIILLVVGITLAVCGVLAGGGQAMTGFGSGISASSLVMTALRLVTSQNISLTSGGGQYTPPPM